MKIVTNLKPQDVVRANALKSYALWVGHESALALDDHLPCS